MTVLFKIILLIVLMPSAFLMAYSVKFVVPVRKPLTYSLLLSFTQCILWLLGNVFLPEQANTFGVLIYPFMFLTLFLFTDKQIWFRAFLAQGVLAVTPILCVLVMASTVLPMAELGGLDPQEFVHMDGKYYLLMTVLTNALSCAILPFMAKFLKRLLVPSKEGRGLLWFISIPMTQILLISLFVNLLLDRYSFQGATVCILTGIILSVGSDIACILGYRSYQKIHKMEQDVTHQLEIQTEHYRGLQEDILKINQIRHDLKNQLQAAYYLLQQGHTEEVRSQLDALDQQLSQRVGSRYCENLMVDAVLAEKDQHCREKGIRLQTAALVPLQISLENAYLCSAFSNLLDNSIQATLKSGSPQGPIDLTCDLQEEYLVIRCSNPAVEEKKQKNRSLLREHGLGLSILSEIARQGQGSFQTEMKNGIFTAVLILKR